MKSRITIDFAGLDSSTQFEPVIRVNLEDSEDVRDGLLKAFFQALGGKSNWLSVNYHNDIINGDVANNKRITIYPVRPEELSRTIDIMQNRIDDHDSKTHTPSISKDN